jgi:predicted adenylyl cyclase CyaB
MLEIGEKEIYIFCYKYYVMENIEVEIKAIISEEKYKELIEYFKKEGEFIKEDDQTTYYFDCEEDLRIQKNNSGCKMVLKGGKVHDETREELEIEFDKEHFEKLDTLFKSLGYSTEIKWFRKRHSFKWEDIKVDVDFTKGYGYILELEKMSDEENKEGTLKILKNKLKNLDIELTSREEFDKKFEDYKKNWEKLI